MIRMPLASASLLTIAIALAGCGEDKAPANQAAAPAAQATGSSAPAAAGAFDEAAAQAVVKHCLLYTSPSPRDRQKSRMPSSA